MKPLETSGGILRYRCDVARLGGSDIPSCTYIAILAGKEVDYRWRLRYSRDAGAFRVTGSEFVPAAGHSAGSRYGSETRPAGSLFVDETELRLPSLNDETTRVVAADIDGDDDLDIVLAEGGPGDKQNRVWINDGRGYYVDETSTRLPLIDDFSNDLDIADVDGDDDLDVVVANSIADDNYIMLNDGDGHFTLLPDAIPFSMDESWGVKLCDVTGDDRPDLVFANILGRNRLFVNDGGGAFTDASETSLPDDFDDTFEVCCEDVNGDSANDIIFVNWDMNFGLQNRLLINDGTGVFHDSTSTLMPQISDGSFDGEMTDVDGDQRPDLVVANKWLFDFISGEQIPGTGKNFLLTNDSVTRPGRFIDGSSQSMPDLYDFTNGVAAADIDGENGPDIFFANGDFGAGASNRLYLNDSNGIFSDASALWLPGGGNLSVDAFVADYDGDGDNDVFVANLPPDTTLSGAQNRILINRTISGIGDSSPDPIIPRALSLSQNYPNPFNPSTTIEISIPEGVDGPTFLGVYTIRGRLVRVLEEGRLAAGTHVYHWDGKGNRGEALASGVYILRLRSGGGLLTRKMSLVR